MVRPLGALAILGLAACAPVPEPEPDPPLCLFLLAGQSNMAGRGEVAASDRTPHPRVFAVRADVPWGPASEPLHFDKPDIVGVGPGFAFGKALAEEFPDIRIGLIPAAVGGSSIRAWRPHAIHEQTGAYPWDDALYRTWRTLATTGGELRGIIWHQGESDTGDFADEYEDALVDLVGRFRAEFDEPNLPFVAGELAEFYMENRNREGGEAINRAIRAAVERLDRAAVVSLEGATAKPDGIHFDAKSGRALGERYAEAMAELLRNP